jgi:hypothetical protein
MRPGPHCRRWAGGWRRGPKGLLSSEAYNAIKAVSVRDYAVLRNVTPRYLSLRLLGGFGQAVVPGGVEPELGRFP